MSLLDQGLRGIQRIFTLGPGAPAPDPEPVPPYPGQRRRPDATRVLVAVAAAVALPIAFGAALIPLRDHVSQSISLLMVVPVLVVALLAGRRLGSLAALAAAVAYDVLHTQPYYRPTIDDPDDIVETVVLLVIGITIGYVAESAQRAVVAARVRREELTAVTNFMEHIGTSISGEELAEHASTSIVRLLDARECVWRPDYQGTASPVLQPDGSLHSALPGSGRGDGGGTLPSALEIPVGRPPTERGRFVVRTNRRASVSIEERRAAATIATTLARCIGP
jgi:K+-sensing histidine kinase KdpD